MTTPVTTRDDQLAHISYQDENLDKDSPDALFNKVSATSGSITIISGFGCSVVLSWSFSSDSVTIGVQLQTPFGNVNLVNATLNTQQPCVTFGGSVAGFKAEGEVCFDFSSMTLTASGQVCAPLLGCKSGSVSVNV